MPGSLCRRSLRLGCRCGRPAPAPLVVAAFLLSAAHWAHAAGPEESAMRSGQADRSVLIREHAGWNKNCDSVAPPPVYLFNPPRHGKVCTRTEQIRITSMYAGTQGQCIGQSVRGVRLIYQPEGDFAGEDSLLYVVQYPSVLRTVSVKVSVPGDQAETSNITPDASAMQTSASLAPIPACTELLF
jgi:hypothetical protein